jgi:hypothetical protein
MTKIMQALKKLFDTEQARQERVDSYLNEAVDIYDLEYRMRKVDRDEWERH